MGPDVLDVWTIIVYMFSYQKDRCIFYSSAHMAFHDLRNAHDYHPYYMQNIYCWSSIYQ